MNPFFISCAFVITMGILINPIMKSVPRRFDPTVFPFRNFAFEKQGKLYEKLKIRKWKDSLPDMSRYIKWLAPKNLKSGATPAHLQTLIQESCVAGLSHAILAILSHGVLIWWKNGRAWIFLAVYNLLFNLPYIMIQRYNRPRFIKMLRMLQTN